MHYSRSHEEFQDTLISVLARWTQMSVEDPAMTNFKKHFQREWLYPPSRFWRWQVYHTGQGVATTNNPLEQYHGPLKKSLGLTLNTSVLGLLQAMEKGMTLCVGAENFQFVTVCEVSKRMRQRYNGLKILGLLQAVREPGNENPCFRIKQETYDDALARFRSTSNDQAAPTLIKMGDRMKHRHECLNQPDLGWRVNTIRRDCGCDQWFKHGICVHVIHACLVDLKECPGLPQPRRRFVNRTVRRRSVRSVRGRGRGQPRPNSPDI